MKKKQRDMLLIGFFILVFIVSVVYAATTGMLTFSGTTSFGTNVDLNIVDESLDVTVAGESIGVTSNGDILEFNLVLDEPGENRTIEFYIENVGNKAAQLGTLSTNVVGDGLNVVWPNLNNVIIQPGPTNVMGPYTIVVTWDETQPDVVDEVELSAQINYQQYTPLTP